MQFLSKTVLKKFINKEISSVGFDESYVKYAVKKHKFISIKIFDVTPSQATIIKQTALSVGCDCAVNRGVIDCSVSFSDCILSGTLCQIEHVAKKLVNQPFSLSKLSDILMQQVENETKDYNRSKIVGILNLTPNSFSDGGEFVEIDKAINHAIDMIEQGAQVIDIGAQSTKPYADLVSVVYEIEKVVPIVTALKTAYPHIDISVDTMSLGCAKAAIDAGADIINDVSFLSNPEFINIFCQPQAHFPIALGSERKRAKALGATATNAQLREWKYLHRQCSLFRPLVLSYHQACSDTSRRIRLR